MTARFCFFVRGLSHLGEYTEEDNAVSVTKLIRENPNDMTEAAKYYIDMLKSIHAIEAEDGEVPDMKETALAVLLNKVDKLTF